MASNKEEIISKLSTNIADQVGTYDSEELSAISNDFRDSLRNAIGSYGSSMFDKHGILDKLKMYDAGSDTDNEAIKNIVNGFKEEYMSAKATSVSEILLRKDMKDVCEQMPELSDTVYLIRDSVIECNIAGGGVSRDIIFEDQENTESDTRKNLVKDIEKHHNLLMMIKNHIVPTTLMLGECYVQVVPYSKIFAELEARKKARDGGIRGTYMESGPGRRNKKPDFNGLASKDNIKLLTESVTPKIKQVIKEEKDINKLNGVDDSRFHTEGIKHLLESISVKHGSSSSMLVEEYGVDALESFIKKEYVSYCESVRSPSEKKSKHFTETMVAKGILPDEVEELVNIENFADIKGCYINYLDGLRMLPIRMGRKIVGYYYATNDAGINHAGIAPSGVTDLSFREFVKDKKMIDSLANIIMNTFDKKLLNKNIELKHEIAEIIMTHQFSDGKLSFVFIPENEVVRFKINEDQNGKGHSIIEPGIYPARMYVMLNMYNAQYILNNNTTRVHYVKSSGINKNYANSVQRTMRMYADRRIGVSDIYSFNGAMGKLGGMGEMVLPAGRGDYKALETDTIEAVNMPISIEFLELQRRQALTATRCPQNMIINAIDEVDFAKTLEMANARFISTISSYKIDLNAGVTELYQMILRAEGNMTDSDIQSLKFQFHENSQQEMSITNEMIANFNEYVTMVGSLYYSPADLMDPETQAPTFKGIALRKALARDKLPQLDIDNLDKLIDQVNKEAGADEANEKARAVQIDDDEVDNIIKASEAEDEGKEPEELFDDIPSDDNMNEIPLSPNGDNDIQPEDPNDLPPDANMGED